MPMHPNRAKFSYCNFDEIQDKINQGELNAYDIIYTKDTHENIIISPDYSVISVKSKIYRFIDINSAEVFLNTHVDTYEGQIIAVLSNGSYSGYIVNRNRAGRFYVSPLGTYSGQLDYNTLGNRPIEQLIGTLDSPILLESLDSGIYKVNGQYKITEQLETVFNSSNSNLFLVEHKIGSQTTYIKKIEATEITDYIISDQESLKVSVVPTTAWLEAKGYITEDYVDLKIEALNFITKKEIEDYVSNIVLQNIDTIVNERIEDIFNQKFAIATEYEALTVFTNIFVNEEKQHG